MKRIGIGLLIIGIAALFSLAMFHFTFLNAPLLLALLAIVLGAVLMVWGTKRESPY